eukprot:scaffold163781_cov25-Tisochrysis_lutea.AAC.2
MSPRPSCRCIFRRSYSDQASSEWRLKSGLAIGRQAAIICDGPMDATGRRPTNDSHQNVPLFLSLGCHLEGM